MRLAFDLLLVVAVLTLPIEYVVILGSIYILGFGMYEAVGAGVMYDATHVALFEHLSPGEFPLTAFYLIMVTIGVFVRTLFVRFSSHHV
jgi:hypothetical protein